MDNDPTLKLLDISSVPLTQSIRAQDIQWKVFTSTDLEAIHASIVKHNQYIKTEAKLFELYIARAMNGADTLEQNFIAQQQQNVKSKEKNDDGAKGIHTIVHQRQ